MRPLTLHLAWASTHFVRSLWPNRDPLIELERDIRLLQVEIHRTHQLLKGYSEVLESSLKISVVIEIGLCLVLLLILAHRGLSKGVQPIHQPLDFLEEVPALPDTEITANGSSRSSPGPVRPSDLGKGKRAISRDGQSHA